MKIETEYTNEIYITYIKTQYKQRIKKYAWFINLLNLMALIDFCNNFSKGNLVYLEGIIFIIVFITINTTMIPNQTAKKIMKKNPQLIGIKTKYHFKEKEVEIIQQNKKTNLLYKDINLCIETKKYIFLCLNKEQAFYVDKQNLSKTQKEDLRYLLEDETKNYKKIRI